MEILQQRMMHYLEEKSAVENRRIPLQNGKIQDIYAPENEKSAFFKI